VDRDRQGPVDGFERRWYNVTDNVPPLAPVQEPPPGESWAEFYRIGCLPDLSKRLEIRAPQGFNRNLTQGSAWHVEC
jgi:hypothetical protein